MKDLHSKLTIVSAIDNAVLSADNTPVAIDLRGYNMAEIVLAIGIGGITFTGTNKIEFILTHSDDDLAYTAVTAADVLGVTPADGGIIKALKTAQAQGTVSRFGYKGGKRYIKLLADFSGTHGTGTPIAAMVLKGGGYLKPEADQA